MTEKETNAFIDATIVRLLSYRRPLDKDSRTELRLLAASALNTLNRDELHRHKCPRRCCEDKA